MADLPFRLVYALGIPPTVSLIEILPVLFGNFLHFVASFHSRARTHSPGCERPISRSEGSIGSACLHPFSATRHGSVLTFFLLVGTSSKLSFTSAAAMRSSPPGSFAQSWTFAPGVFSVPFLRYLIYLSQGFRASPCCKYDRNPAPVTLLILSFPSIHRVFPGLVTRIQSSFDTLHSLIAQHGSRGSHDTVS